MSEQTPEQAYLEEHGQPGKDHKAADDHAQGVSPDSVKSDPRSADKEGKAGRR